MLVKGAPGVIKPLPENLLCFICGPMDPWWQNSNEIWIRTEIYFYDKIHFEGVSLKWRPLCLGLNVVKVNIIGLLCLCSRWGQHIMEKDSHIRARCFPLPDSPGQVKLPVGQVDLDNFFFFISYKQIEEFQNSWSRASDDFEKGRALHMNLSLCNILYMISV